MDKIAALEQQLVTPRAQGKEWADRKAVKKIPKCTCEEHLTHFGADLISKEHARAVRICRQAKMLKFHGLRDTDTNEWLDGYEAACHDILTALQRGRGGEG